MDYGKISVIIPVYRTEKYLEKCVCSVLAQKYENIEIILVDDGSDDSSGAICDELEKRDGRVKVVHKENGGLSSARNAGIALSSGEYLAFVDSDDYIAPDMYATLIENISDSDIIVSGYYSVSGKKIKEHIGFDKLTVLSKQQAITELLKDERIKNHVWNKLFRRELFGGVEFPEGRTFEDILTTYKLFEKSEKITYVPYAEYYYVAREGAISQNGDCDTCFARYTAHYLRYEDLKERMPEKEGILLKQLFIQARALMLCTDVKEQCYLPVKEFFAENSERILKNAELGFFERREVKMLAKGNVSALKTAEIFRKAEKLLKRIFERKKSNAQTYR